MLKKSSIEIYYSIHDYDFICISETYLHSSVSLGDKDISIKCYNINWADHSKMIFSTTSDLICSV